MSLRQQIEDDVGAVFLNAEEHAETVARLPGGSGDAENVLVVDEDAEPEVTFERGEGRRFRKTLWLSADQAVSQSDAWTIDGERWETETIGKSEAGMRPVKIVRHEQRRTETSGNTNAAR